MIAYSKNITTLAFIDLNSTSMNKCIIKNSKQLSHTCSAHKHLHHYCSKL